MIRCRALVISLLLTFAIGTAAVAIPAAAAPPPPTAGQVAAGWLARQMTDRSHFTVTFSGVTYPNQGGTIDAIFAFAATGSANDYGTRAITWLERPGVLSNYIGDGTTNSYAGATAKVALAAEVRGLNPDNFAKVDLLARLENRSPGP